MSWVVRDPRDLLLDPSCGDGAFLRWHKRSVGIEVDADNAGLTLLDELHDLGNEMPYRDGFEAAYTRVKHLLE